MKIRASHHSWNFIIKEHLGIIASLFNPKLRHVSGLTIGQQMKLNLILRYVKKHHSMIDVGCGTMWLTRFMRKRGYRCIGFADEPPADILGDIRTYRFEQESYDIVIALEIIEHVDCTKKLIQMLKPGGLLILSTPLPSMDWACVIGERMQLFQRRTSPHTNLCSIQDIPLSNLYSVVLFGVDQFGVFQKPKYD